jgi:hypothetical protein
MVGCQGVPDIELLFREFSDGSPADVPVVAFKRLDQCAFGRHNFCPASWSTDSACTFQSRPVENGAGKTQAAFG